MKCSILELCIPVSIQMTRNVAKCVVFLLVCGTLFGEVTADPTTCQEELFLNENNNYTVLIESPNYPDVYPANADCNWIVHAPANNNVEISAISFETNNCDYDFLEITDLTVSTPSGNQVLGKFCKTVGPLRVRSFGDLVNFRFQASDHSEYYSGFRIRVTLSKCTGYELSCPNDAENTCIDPNMLCDGKPDCPNASDEYCPAGCGKSISSPYGISERNDQRILGGTEVKPHSWPWQVALSSSTQPFICGGSILNHHWILTSAICCGPYLDSHEGYSIRVGAHNLTDDHEPNAVTYEISKVIIHPDFFWIPYFSYDFCLVKTNIPIAFNDDVAPVCYPSAVDQPNGTDCHITGWGETVREDFLAESTKPNRSSVLLQADVKVIDLGYCNELMAETLGEYASITDDMLCTSPNADQDSCQGDAGGPLVCRSKTDPTRWELTGVISWAIYNCASPGYPQIYGRTAKVLNWISDVLFNG